MHNWVCAEPRDAFILGLILGYIVVRDQSGGINP
jgi:hypothetical protein